MDKLENLFKCKICDEVFNKPTILGCGHTFCTTCLTDCEMCPTCDGSSWRRRGVSKIQVSAKWHLGHDIVMCFRHDRKDTDKIMSALKNNLKCPICCAFINKATVTVCGHVYCKRCLESWTARTKDCPVCRTPCHEPGGQPFLWPLGDRLSEETRRTFKRTQPDDSGKTRTTRQRPGCSTGPRGAKCSKSGDHRQP